MILMQRNQTTVRLLKQLFIWRILCSLLISPMVFADASADFVSDTVHPVINVNNKQTSISRNGLSAIFKMRLIHWNDGTPVTVFVLPDDNPLHKKFCKRILNVFPHQLRRIWNNAVFSGSGQAPITVSSIEEMKEKVANTPGAIGNLSISESSDLIKALDIQ